MAEAYCDAPRILELRAVIIGDKLNKTDGFHGMNKHDGMTRKINIQTV